MYKSKKCKACAILDQNTQQFFATGVHTCDAEPISGVKDCNVVSKESTSIVSDSDVQNEALKEESVTTVGCTDTGSL